MASESKRLLYKGALLPPRREPWSESYTQSPASKGQVPVRDRKNDKIPVIEFSSRAVPQPFLDPSVIPKRVQAEKEWKLKQEREARQGGPSRGP